jgi:hypothetical protein
MQFYNGNLDLVFDSSITELPIGLVVNGDLDIMATSITTFPNGLVVRGNLHAEHTKIKKPPIGLVLGGKIVCQEDSILVNLAFEGYVVEIVE